MNQRNNRIFHPCSNDLTRNSRDEITLRCICSDPSCAQTICRESNICISEEQPFALRSLPHPLASPLLPIPIHRQRLRINATHSAILSTDCRENPRSSIRRIIVIDQDFYIHAPIGENRTNACFDIQLFVSRWNADRNMRHFIRVEMIAAFIQIEPTIAAKIHKTKCCGDSAACK